MRVPRGPFRRARPSRALVAFRYRQAEREASTEWAVCPLRRHSVSQLVVHVNNGKVRKGNWKFWYVQGRAAHVKTWRAAIENAALPSLAPVGDAFGASSSLLSFGYVCSARVCGISAAGSRWDALRLELPRGCASRALSLPSVSSALVVTRHRYDFFVDVEGRISGGGRVPRPRTDDERGSVVFSARGGSACVGSASMMFMVLT